MSDYTVAGVRVESGVTLNDVDRLIILTASRWPGSKNGSIKDIVVTSGTDGLAQKVHGDGRYSSYHYGYLMYENSHTGAVDFSVAVNNSKRDAIMRDFAAWFMPLFKSAWIEFIHSTPFDDDNGYYIKNGNYVSASTYNEPGAHLSHIHAASSWAKMAGVRASIFKGYVTPGVPQNGSGPVAPVKLGTTDSAPTSVPVASTLPASPDPHVVFGWDVSQYDFDRGLTVAEIKKGFSEGIRFFTAKATELAPGELFVNSYFGTALGAARDAGVPFLGAYVVPRTGPSIVDQAQAAINHVRAGAPWLLSHPRFVWQIDTERWSYDAVSATIGKALGDKLLSMTGKNYLHYAPKWAYGDSVPSGGLGLWASNYSASGSARPFRQQWADVAAAGASMWTAYSGRTPLVLQYASDATIGGQTVCDANAFRGTVDDLAKIWR